MASGTASVLIGDGIEVLLLFAVTILVARSVGQSQFGLFVLGAALIKFLAVVAGLGYRMGVPRFIAAHASKGEWGKAWSGIVSSTRVVCVVSPLLGAVLFAAADAIGTLVRKPGLADTLRIMAVGVPLLALMDLLTAHLRGVRDVRGRALFQRVLRPLSAVLFMLPILIWRLSYPAVLWAQNASYAVTVVMLALYGARMLPRAIPVREQVPVTRDLLLFSLPLWGGGILQQLLQSTDTFVVGALSAPHVVGLYSSAMRFSLLIQMVPASAAFIFLPVATHLLASHKTDELKTLYAVMTKWVFLLSLPFVLYIFFGAERLLTTCFGPGYAAAARPLQILVLGSTLHVMFGQNAMVCVALGLGRHFLWSQVASVAANLALAVLLVPVLGAAGAAIAASSALVLSNVLLTTWVYHRSRLHPFSPDYVRLIAAVAVLSLLLFAVPPVGGGLWGFLALGVGVVSVLALALAVSRGVTAWDVAAAGQLEQRVTGRRRFTERLIRPLSGAGELGSAQQWAADVFGRGFGRFKAGGRFRRATPEPGPAVDGDRATGLEEGPGGGTL